ncbi:hypothetical protein [Neisseria musculi]|uniref:Uncharacterized protein n=1 Tax=Neisseria musculi TaxID=1815583 RepID=A0A7H1ME41_9NEIS|nr:hypothetical protein [Neisseria musculi]QNT59906.1 hypothetical protein H7A79_0334 [Neisseria musculi]
MIVDVLKPCKTEIKAVRINVCLHEDVAEQLPEFLLADGGDFEIVIDVDTGKVLNCQGNEAVSVTDKVSDSGTYTLLGKDNEEIVKLVYEYVPNKLIPGEYGDYIDLKINTEGLITNWPKSPAPTLRARHCAGWPRGLTA